MLILVAIVVFIVVFIVFKTVQETNYWNKSEKDYRLKRESGLSKAKALFEISKKRHPELSDEVHHAIINKFDDIGLLVNFHAGALPNGKIEDRTALEYLESTTIYYLGPNRYKVKLND